MENLKLTLKLNSSLRLKQLHKITLLYSQTWILMNLKWRIRGSAGDKICSTMFGYILIQKSRGFKRDFLPPAAILVVLGHFNNVI